jgi:hypothetical protein
MRYAQPTPASMATGVVNRTPEHGCLAHWMADEGLCIYAAARRRLSGRGWRTRGRYRYLHAPSCACGPQTRASCRSSPRVCRAVLFVSAWFRADPFVHLTRRRPGGWGPCAVILYDRPGTQLRAAGLRRATAIQDGGTEGTASGGVVPEWPGTVLAMRSSGRFLLRGGKREDGSWPLQPNINIARGLQPWCASLLPWRA